MKTSLYHLQINVSNAKISLPFYKDMFTFLGYKITDQSSEHIGVSNGTTDFWIIETEKKYKTNLFHRKNTGLNHIALRVSSKEEVDSFANEFLKARNIPTLYDTPKVFSEYREGYYAVFFEDPDRIKLEVTFIPEKKKDRWFEYFEITKNKPPSPLLVKTLRLLKNREVALDLGGGALKDTKYLLDEGFKKVIVVDSEQLMAEAAKGLSVDKTEILVTTFDKYNFPEEYFDVVNAQWSIPFNSPKTFDRVFEDLKKSIKKDGFFVGQLFGVNDEWNVPGKDMTFHTKDQAKELLSEMEIIEFDEEDKDSQTANGTPKHWHVFHIIAKKK